MNQKILLITGWGGGTKLLHPLKIALQDKGHHVELINIFNVFDDIELQRQTENAKDFDVIIGWSLGGQLATLLVNQIEQKYQQQKVLITLASNPCFVANETWQTAMPQDTFQKFKQSFEQDVSATLFKFGFMVCQGIASTKQDLKILQSLIQPQKIELLKQGLALLEQLNIAEIQRKYTGQQYHLFAKQDALVDSKVVQNIQNFSAKFLAVELIQGSHGFPIFQVELITDKICQYLHKNNQTSG